MNNIRQFVAQNSALSHTLVSIWVFLTTAFYSSPEFHQGVVTAATDVYHALPKSLQWVIVSLAIPLITYWRTQKSAGPSASTPVSTSKLGVYALCSLILCGSMTACTAAQVQTAAKDIAAYLPTAESTASEIASVVGLFLPADQALISGTVTAVNAGLTQLQTGINSCLQTPACMASPTSSGWQQIVAIVNNLVSQVDQSTLASAHIVDPASQQKAIAVLGLVSVAIHFIDSKIQSTLPATQVQATAAARTVKLSQVIPLWTPSNRKAMNELTEINAVSFDQWERAEVSYGF